MSIKKNNVKDGERLGDGRVSSLYCGCCWGGVTLPLPLSCAWWWWNVGWLAGKRWDAGTYYDDDNNNHRRRCGRSLLVTTMVATLPTRRGPCIWNFFLNGGGPYLPEQLWTVVTWHIR